MNAVDNIIRCSSRWNTNEWQSFVQDNLYRLDQLNSEILIHWPSEGGVQYQRFGTDWFSWIYKQCKTVNVCPSKLIVIWGNTNASELYKRWCNIFQPSVQFKKVVYYPIWLEITVNFTSDYSKHYINQQKRNKLFTCLIGRPDKHRQATLLHLYNNNLIDKTIWTWVSTAKWDLPNELATQIPKSVDGFIHTNDISTTSPMSNEFYKVYDQTYIDIVTETFYYHDSKSIAGYDWWESVFITEKTWRSIFNKRPFIIIGNRYSLRELRRLGFKTFPHLFDETYDELDNNSRLGSALTQLKHINEDEIHQKYFSKETQEILDHNYNHMLQLSKQQWF